MRDGFGLSQASSWAVKGFLSVWTFCRHLAYSVEGTLNVAVKLSAKVEGRAEFEKGRKSEMKVG